MSISVFLADTKRKREKIIREIPVLEAIFKTKWIDVDYFGSKKYVQQPPVQQQPAQEVPGA